MGFSDLPPLLPNSYVEVDVILDSQGNLAAKTVEVQAVENPFPVDTGVAPSTALIGTITAIQTDAAGNPKTFNYWVRDAEPDDTSTLPMDAIYQVDLTSGPTYQASALGPNFANLTFGPQNLAVGQELVIHGGYIKPPSTGIVPGISAFPFIIQPTAIYLKSQSIRNGELRAPGVARRCHRRLHSTPCCALLNGVPIYVVTNNQTSYLNATGLGALTTVNSLVVKGMPDYEAQPVTINGVAIPGGSQCCKPNRCTCFDRSPFAIIDAGSFGTLFPFPPRKMGEVKVFALQELGQQDDLPGVVGEVFGDVERPPPDPVTFSVFLESE